IVTVNPVLVRVAVMDVITGAAGLSRKVSLDAGLGVTSCAPTSNCAVMVTVAASVPNCTATAVRPPVEPAGDRPGRVSADQVVNRLRRKLTSVPGATLFLQAQQDIQIGGRGGASQYQFTLSDEDLKELNTWAPQLQSRMRAMPELRDVSSDQQDQGLATNLAIDRDTAARLGITTSMIDQTLYDAFGQRQVSTMYTGLNQYFVVMEVDPKYSG